MNTTQLSPNTRADRRLHLPRLHWWIGCVLLLTLTACQPATSPRRSPLAPPFLPDGRGSDGVAPRASPLASASCPFTLPGETEGEGYTCGILHVPQFRDEPAGRQLGIFYAQLKATTPDASQPPLLYLAGGPGASGVYDAPLLASTLAPLRNDRDLIFFDIRGAGFSQPRLDCAELAEAGDGVACMAALRSQGIEPLAFNTVHNAADAADLLAALGYKQADLLGVSYGTRLALEMVRSQPHVVRAVVLDSTVAPETLTYELQALGDYEARLWPFADCEATPACSGRFGAMGGRFLALLNRLDDAENALTVDGVKLGAGALYHLTDATLDRPDLLALLPLIVDELDRGVITTYQALLNGEFGAPPPPAAPIYAFEQFIPRYDAYLRTLPAAEAAAPRAALAALPVDDAQNQALLAFIAATVPDPLAAELRAIAAPMTPYEHARLLAAYGADLALYEHGDLGAVKNLIDCQEEIPFVDPDAVRKNQAVIPAPSLLPPYDFAASVRGEQRACLDQGITPAPASFKDAVTSDKPVLLLAGAQDTITPALWGQLAAESLPNAVQVTFPAYGHALLYRAGACVARIAAAFLDDPAHPPATACVPAPDYALDPPLLLALSGRMWRLQGWAGAEASALPVTAFFGGGMVGGLDGCGAYSGEFTLEGDRLAVAQLAAAETGCAEEAHILQAAFLSALGGAETIYTRGSRLLLTTTAGDLLVFTAEDDLPLEQTVWLLAALRTADAPAPALSDVAVTARFADGALLGGGGCNLYEAAYTLTPDALSDALRLEDVRRVGSDQCDSPPGVMAQEAALLALLADVRSHRVIGQELLLYDESGAPLLVFYAVAE